MKIVLALIRKEFLQIARNKGLRPLLLVMPFMQLLILVHAITLEVKNIRVWIVVPDAAPDARRLADRIEASEYFSLAGMTPTAAPGAAALADGRTDAVLELPRQFNSSLLQQGQLPIRLTANAVETQKAQFAQMYLSRVLEQFGQETAGTLRASPSPGGVQLVAQNWYNPELAYIPVMLSGLLALLVSLVGMMVAAMNIVRETELGTIEQLNVTPLRPWQFVTGKLVPFWIIGMFQLALGLALSWLVYDLPVRGNLLTLFTFAGIYLVAILSLALYISIHARTQVEAVFLSYFLLIIFILLSGLFTPVENMPELMRHLTLANPVRHFVTVNRSVLIKGAGFSDLSVPFGVMSGLAAFLLLLAVTQYRKTR